MHSTLVASRYLLAAALTLSAAALPVYASAAVQFTDAYAKSCVAASPNAEQESLKLECSCAADRLTQYLDESQKATLLEWRKSNPFRSWIDLKAEHPAIHKAFLSYVYPDNANANCAQAMLSKQEREMTGLLNTLASPLGWVEKANEAAQQAPQVTVSVAQTGASAIGADRLNMRAGTWEIRTLLREGNAAKPAQEYTNTLCFKTDKAVRDAMVTLMNSDVSFGRGACPFKGDSDADSLDVSYRCADGGSSTAAYSWNAEKVDLKVTDAPAGGTVTRGETVATRRGDC